MARHNVTVEDSSPLVVYTNYSQWQDSPFGDPDYSSYSGPSQTFNSFHQTNITGASLGFPFNGTGIYVFGSTGPTHGAFTVALTPNNTVKSLGLFNLGTDNENTVTTGFRAEGKLFQQLLFTRTGLDQSVPHFINISNSGNGQFILDYFIVESEVGQSDSSVNEITLDDSHSAFTYPAGAWNSDLSELSKHQDFLQLLNNKTLHSAGDIGAEVSLTFRGTGVAMHGVWYHGSFIARVDNRSAVLVKSSNTGFEPGSYNRPRELIFSADGLDEGMHTIALTNSEASPLNVDYAVVSTTDPKNLDGVTPPSAGGSGLGDNNQNPRYKSMGLGAIVGGSLGGVVLLVLLAISLWLWRRRRQRRERERVDLLSDVETVRQANSWVPWRPASGTGAAESEEHLRVSAVMSSTSDLAVVGGTSRGDPESVAAPPTSQNEFASLPAGHTTPASSGSRGGDLLPTTEPTTSPPSARRHRSGKRRGAAPEPERTPTHEADAGVTLLRSGTVTSTLPPLYDDRWGRDRSSGQ